LSEYQQEYETEEEKKRKRKQLLDLQLGHKIASDINRGVTESVKEETKIMDRMRSAALARLSSDVVERGQHMVAAGLARVFRYERYHTWSLYEYKKGIFSRKERHEQEEDRETVHMEGYDD
jgi:hypothetical protein